MFKGGRRTLVLIIITLFGKYEFNKYMFDNYLLRSW